MAAEKLRVSAARCLVFEDVISAAISAKKAGMTVCGVYDERSAARMEEMRSICDLYINGFDEMMEDK
jgi:beta-phosphoglucomutase-like phosphatase (HAD superfamily)